MTIDRELTNGGHVHRFIVTSKLEGWDVREEEDSIIIHRVQRDDWHRVETDIQLFELAVKSLQHAGWMEN